MKKIQINTGNGCRVTKADKPQYEILFDILQEREICEKELSQMGISNPSSVASKVERKYGIDITRRKVPNGRSTFGYGKKHTVHYSLS